MRCILNSFVGIFALADKGLPLRYEVRVAYYGGRPIQRVDTFVLDIERFLGVTFREDALTKAVVEGFKSVSDGIRKDDETTPRMTPHIERRLESGLTINSALVHRLDQGKPEEYLAQSSHPICQLC